MKDLLLVGCGNMGEAILSRIHSKMSIICLEKDLTKLEELKNKYKSVEFVSDITQKIEVKNVLLAIKPQVFPSFALSYASLIDCNGVVSIMAGIVVDDISKYFEGIPVCRVMPNTPAFVGEAASGYFLNNLASEEEDFEKFVKDVLESIGSAVKVASEYLLDAVTGLSGSGPAYFFSIIDAFTEAGIRNGLTAKDAQILSAQTMKGAAEMILRGEKSISELKYGVMSPGGTTAAGIVALESAGMRTAIYDAVDSATQRSRELGK